MALDFTGKRDGGLNCSVVMRNTLKSNPAKTTNVVLSRWLSAKLFSNRVGRTTRIETQEGCFFFHMLSGAINKGQLTVVDLRI